LKRQLFGVVAITLAALPALGFAQVKQLGPNPTSQDFINGLTPGPGAPTLKFRGLRVLNANPTDEGARTSGPAVAVDIKFALNSADLTDQAKATLKQMATAMKSNQLASYHFLLEGHTDTIGSPDYNLTLSKRRAEAVRSYLTDQFGVDSSRLQAVGRGEDALLDPNHPTSPVNRRVQVVNMGGTN
jgi:OmpA-OmpF porin, OOP family